MAASKLNAEVRKKTAEVLAREGSQNGAAKALGIARSTLQSRLRAMAREDAPPSAGKTGRSLADFRATHDKSFIVPQKVRTALAALGDGWDYELQFSKLAGVSLADLSAFRSLFEAHIVIVDRTKRAWAGKVSIAEKMRGMVQ